MTSLWKQEKAEADLEPLLRRVREADPTLLTTFPRSVEHILAAALPSLMVRRKAGLKGGDVKALLSAELDITCDYLEEEQDLCGLTFATDKLVIVFVDTQHGDDAARFTLAHEAGHLATEYISRLERGEFSDTRMLRVDPIENLSASGKGSPRREVIANSCAAALLAPIKEVRHVVEQVGEAELVDAVRFTFGLSRQAASIRLMELGHIPQACLDHQVAPIF